MIIIYYIELINLFILLRHNIYLNIVSCFILAANLRIVGGNEAADGQFTYQASLKSSETLKHFCGGSIIGSRHILTAANCLKDKTETDFFVTVGTNNLLGGDNYEIQSFVIHENYDEFVFENNIAFVTLKNQIIFETNRVERIPLSTQPLEGGEEVTFSGWGTLNYGDDEMPNELQYIKLQVITNEECDAMSQPNGIKDTEVCTFTKEGEGACRGDGGSPLVYNYQLAAILSWGRPCAIGYPDVYTRIDKYNDWILEQFQHFS